MASVSYRDFTTLAPSIQKRLILLPPSPSSKKKIGRRLVAFAKVNGSSHRKIAETLRVAYQGAPGAYSEFAAKTAFPDCTAVPCRGYLDAIMAVETGEADRAVLPVENTMSGSTVRNYDLLLCHNLRIVQEVSLFVQYCLLAMPGVRKWELKRVISHPMALAQCGRNLAQLGLDREAVDDTAGAVELLSTRRMLDTGAIASSRAALLYGLDVLAQGFQDESWNVTRFLILSKHPPIPPELSPIGLKTSMVVAHHGATLPVVLRILSAFSSRNINLTKLEVAQAVAENRPIMILDADRRGTLKTFPSVLYVDFEGSMDDPKVKDALAEVSALAGFFRSLGSYKADPKIYDLQEPV
ncbi:hypothetical protein ACLOJK_005133 [Asimina triloba]